MPIKSEIEIKQLLYLKRILDKNNDDPVQLSYREMLKFSEEVNLVKDVLGLQRNITFQSMMRALKIWGQELEMDGREYYIQRGFWGIKG